MKLRNVGSILLSLIVCTGLLMSCEQPSVVKGETSRYASLSFEMEVPAEEKGLVVWAPGEVKSFEYRAVPSFPQDPDTIGTIVGDCPEWTPITFYDMNNQPARVGHLRASMGYYQPGGWTIEVRALNGGGNPVYWGTTGEVFLNAGEVNGFVVQLHGVTSIGADAGLKVSFSTLRNEELLQDNPLPVMKIRWLDGTEKIVRGSEWASRLNSDGGSIFHELELAHLPAGETDVTIWTESPDGSIVTKEMLAVLLVNGEVSKIEGTLESGEYSDPSFDITEDQSEIEAKIVPVSGITSVTESIDHASGKGNKLLKGMVGTEIRLEYKVEGAAAKAFRWYVDGVEKGTEKVFTSTFQSPGQYQVTAVTERDEKISSEEILLIVEEGK